MKKFATIAFICIIATLGCTLQAQVAYQHIDRYKGFMLYENGECSYYALYGKCMIGDVEYIKEEKGRYAYRQEGNKIYCYSFTEGKESLVLDFDLNVGDNFTSYEGFNVVVEQKSDTLLTCRNTQRNCKKLLLRGIEQPHFTDVWIEGVGSLKYGINPPQTGETYLLHSSICMEECEELCDYCTFTFEHHKDHLHGIMVELGEETYDDSFDNAYAGKLLTFNLSNDTLHIGGYIGTYCEQSLYFLLKEDAGEIHMTSVPFPLDPEADCRAVNRIDIKVPGFSQNGYIVYYRDQTFGVSHTPTSVSFTEKVPIVPCHDLMGRPVETPAKGVYIVNGKKVVIND